MIKCNPRLNEIRLSLSLNQISKLEPYEFEEARKVLHAVFNAITHGTKVNDFYKFIYDSVNDVCMGASDKEKLATVLTFYKGNKAAKKLNLSYLYFVNKFKDLRSRDFITEEYVNKLEPRYKDEYLQKSIIQLNDFIANFNFPLGNRNHRLKDNKRILEIEFYLIVDKLENIFHSSSVVLDILRQVGKTFKLDGSTLGYMYYNMNKIDKSVPRLSRNKQFFKQEIINLGYLKGLSKGTIGTKILGKNSNYLYRKDMATNTSILGTDKEDWFFYEMLDWSNIDTNSVKKFIELFHNLIEYDL